MKLSIKFILVIGFSILCVLACKDNALAVKKIEHSGGWKFEEPIACEFSLNESSSDAFNAYLVLTHNEDFPFENVYLRTHILAQNDTIFNEVKSFDLQNDIGQWLGDKKPNGYQIKLLLAESIKSSNPNLIQVKVAQYSREEHLKGVVLTELIIDRM